MKELSPELESALVAYLEGDCTPHEADLLKAWLAEDAAHAEFLYGMKHLYAGRSAASEAPASMSTPCGAGCSSVTNLPVRPLRLPPLNR